MHSKIRFTLIESLARLGQEDPSLEEEINPLIASILMGSLGKIDAPLVPTAVEIELFFRSVIDGIKLYRHRTGRSLKEAKETLEEWRHRIDAVFQGKRFWDGPESPESPR